MNRSKSARPADRPQPHASAQDAPQPAPAASPASAIPAVPAVLAAPVVPAATADFRTRARAAADIVHGAFGIDPERQKVCDARDACRLVIALIIESLITSEERVSTQELAAMSKLVAEHRRLDLAEMEIDRKFRKEVSEVDTSGNGSPKSLPPHLGRIVRDLYGTNLADDDA